MNIRHFIAIITGLAMTCPALAIDLPLVNAGFEASAIEPTGWNTSQHAGEAAYEMAIDSAEKTEGEQSFRIKRITEQVYGMINQRVLLPKNVVAGTVRFSAMLRTERVGEGGWVLLANFIGRGGEILAQVRSRPLSGHNPWQRVSVTSPIPKNAHSIEPSLVLLDDGTAWADDVRLSIDVSQIP